MNDADPALLEAARRGDDGALDALLARHQGQIYRFGLKMCGDEEDAKDVAQETLIAMAKGIRDFRGASSVSTWLYAIARSFCVKKRRKSKFAPKSESSLDDAHAPQVASAERGPEEQVVDRELDRALDAAIAGLEPKYREVLVLRDVEGLSAPDVGEILGLSTDAVKSRLHRARLTVRAALAPLLEVPGDKAPGTCPDVLDLFSRHVEGDISAARCTEMETHLRECARCRGACDSLKRTLALCSATPPGDVPRDVQDAVRRAVRKLS